MVISFRAYSPEHLNVFTTLYPSLFNFSKAAQLDSKIEDEMQWGVCIWKESDTEKAGGAGRKENKERQKPLKPWARDSSATNNKMHKSFKKKTGRWT